MKLTRHCAPPEASVGGKRAHGRVAEPPPSQMQPIQECLIVVGTGALGRAPPPAVTPSLNACTKKEIQDMLRQRNLKVSGTKAELLQRLSAARPPATVCSSLPPATAPSVPSCLGKGQKRRLP